METDYNLTHYHHPTTGQILRAIKRSKLPVHHFELTVGIPKNTLAQVLAGSRRLSAKYWHVFAPKPRKKKHQEANKPQQQKLSNLAKSRLEQFTGL